LVKTHLDEVEGLEKKKHNDFHASERNGLMGVDHGPSYLIDTKGKGGGLMSI
jgi:hypothetical protein